MIRKPIILGNNEEKTILANAYNKRLKLVMILMTFAGLIISNVYFYDVWNKQNKNIESRLETFTELRHASLSRFLNSLAHETELWAMHENLTREAAWYFQIWEQLPVAGRKSLRAQYIGGIDNKNASDIYRSYIIFHDQHHKNREAFMMHHGYYDVFYFNLAGDLVYSYGKEDDFGLNFSNAGGKYAASGLGQVFRKARNATSGTSVFYDYAPYAPSDGAPASFIAAPMFDKSGIKIGVYAIQIPIDKFDAVLQYASGLGNSGETYAVGQDYLMRNNSRLSDNQTLLITTIDTPSVRSALSGKSILAKGRNRRNKKTLIVAKPLEFKGTNWAVVTEMELSELRAPFRPYLWFYFIAVIFVIGFGSIQYYLLTQKPSNSI